MSSLLVVTEEQDLSVELSDPKVYLSLSRTSGTETLWPFRARELARPASARSSSKDESELLRCLGGLGGSNKLSTLELCA